MHSSSFVTIANCAFCRLGSKLPEYIRLIQELPEEDLRLGDLLVKTGAITQRELEEGLAEQLEGSTGETEPAPLGEILVEQQAVQTELVDAALAKQKDVRQRQSQEARFIRVHADKLDSMINLVGELVIASAGAGLLAGRNKDATMIEAVSEIARLVEDIRDGAMRLRMVEIGETFTRFRRVVRDVSKDLGKDVELVISGADTELDKSVVERIGDPLTHLVRNAMDHGIESAQVRLANGKAAQGNAASERLSRVGQHHHRSGRRWRRAEPCADSGKGRGEGPDS
jgi:two-component system, chemotaxis family, sensor kinase CheA